MTTDYSKLSKAELLRKKQGFERLLAAKKAQTSLIAFSRFMEPDPNKPDDVNASLYSDKAHHHVLAEALEKAENGVLLAQGVRFLCVSIGPQKGKSQLVSRNFPAWAEGRDPKRNIMLGSYNDDFARDFGDDVRTIMNKPQYSQVFPRLEGRLRTGSKAKDHMATNAGGKLNFVGRGGSGTGKPADIFIIDDPIKNAEEAESLTIRNTVWNWFLKVADSRTHGGSIVVIVQCMTGDTPVMLADGTEKPLRDIRVGDAVATYKDGELAMSVVTNWRNNGPDSVYEIKTSSGRIVKANERHPFLVSDDGELKWVRTKNLRPGHGICRVNGESGKAKPARGMAAISRLYAEGTAHRITTKSDGLTVLGHLLSTASRGALRTLNTAMELLRRSTSGFWLNRMASAPFAHSHPEIMFAPIGAGSSASITATIPGKSGRCSAMTATWLSGMQKLRQWLLPQQNTSDFILDEIVEITAAGVEDVFDVQIADTENFIANGLVSHNTRWHEDDLIGRLTDKTNPHYPKKMAEKTMYINIPSIVESPELAKALGLEVGASIWEEKFPLWLLEMKRDADPRGFGAMEMGRPTPPEGAFYKVQQIRQGYYRDIAQLPRNLRRYGSADLAVSDDITADDSVVLDWGVDENDVLWLLPVIHWSKKKADATVDNIVEMGKDRWMTFFGEKGQIDRAIRPFLEKRMREENAYFNIETFPNINKGQAALAFRGRLAQGKVRFPAFTEWWQRAEEQMLKFTGSGDDREDDFCDALARMGQGLQMQVTASRTKQASNVVAIRPGSIAWAHQQYTHQRKTEKRKKALMGM